VIEPPTTGSISSRVAGIDIGTNSVLLLILDLAPGERHALLDRASVTRLGQGVDSTGRLDPEAVRRTLDCLRSYARELDRFAVGPRIAVGTSALRDASGAEDFLAQAKDIIGTAPRVLSGEAEARLTFAGALSGLGGFDSATVFDVGGGSTEIIAGRCASENPQVVASCSLDVGAVRLFERWVKNDPPLLDELLAIRQDVHSALPAASSYRGSDVVVGVAGTVTTLFAVNEAMAAYDGTRVHGGGLVREQIERMVQRFASCSGDQRRKMAGLDPRRADIICTGALIVLEVMTWLGTNEIVVSDRGVRWGLVEELARFA
jgi:exopolyphosphatase / guanosine-5'-triphosphate,3'-diphosphate pyrophosphatase